MARILKWQEKLVLACAALLFSVTSGSGLGPRDSAGANRPSPSRVVTVMAGKSGVELAAQKPSVRLVRAALLPVSLPLAAGAYVAMAGAEPREYTRVCGQPGEMELSQAVIPA